MSDKINIARLLISNKRWDDSTKIKGRKIPTVFAARLRRAGFFDTTDHTMRLEIATEILTEYRLSTATKYFNYLKYSGYLGDDNKHTVLEKSCYMKYPSQIRLPEKDEFDTLIKYIYVELEKQTAMPVSTNIFQRDPYVMGLFCIALCWNTGLRRCGVLRITNKHLSELLERSPVLELKNKSSNEWEVFYHPMLIKLIERMSTYYKQYLNVSITIPLFPITKSYIRRLLHTTYIAAVGKSAPVGFGLHSIRYLIATEFAAGNIKNAQLLLGHKHLITTKLYVKHQYYTNKKNLTRIENESKFFQDIVKLVP